MGQGTDLFFNIIAVIFLVLTLLVGVVVLGVASGAMDAPVFAPEATSIAPTQAVLPTLTPSPPPGAELTPVGTPTVEAGS